MARKIRLEMNRDGFRAILTGPEVRGDIQARADRIAAAAGAGFEASSFVARWGNSPRVIGVVRAADLEAARAEATDRSLTRSIDAGR